MSLLFMLDFFGAALSLLCTIFFVRAHRIAWIFGFLAVLLNIVLYFKKGLFGKVFMDGVYIVTTLYGWRQWSPNTQHQEPPITYFSWPSRAKLFAFSGLCLIASSILFKIFTPSTNPTVDGSIVTLGLIAQLLLCRRKLECWYCFLIMDIIVVIIQFEKAIPFHAGLHLIYCGMAIAGILRWKRMLGSTTPIKLDASNMLV